ncbi:DolP-mannose mannosyltransferase [Halolamina salifodinae]|uniref:Uncharacterized protein n=1 Tax=Halolamina salifodinae TaxID=1202767 RepID=A0A8T4GRY3_9EURY|nr:DolP-mannose mannosyltransferase [Halolamina salifodinae]MBP1985609.1 hypothetical protein [Halolamina salifodinae]
MTTEDIRSFEFSDLVERWRLITLSAAVVAFSLSVIREFSGGPTPGADPAFLQHAGWYFTQGAKPYIHFWDVKPPMTHLTTAVLAYFSFGNMFVLHIYSVTLITISGIVSVYLVAKATHHITRDNLASLTAGICMLTIAGYHYHAAQGFYPKFLAITLGLAGIIFQLRQQPIYSGIVVALSAGYIQHGAVFSLLALGLAAQYNGRRGVRITLVAIATTTALVLAPIFIIGSGEAMIVETIIVFVSASEPSGNIAILRRLGKGFVYTGYASIPVLLGVYGLIRIAPKNLSKTWWVLSGATLYAVQIFFVDFDSYPDLFFGLIFVSIGTGLLVASLKDRRRQAVTGVIIAVAVVSVTVLGGFGVVTNKTVYTDSLDDSLDKSDTLIHTSVKAIEGHFNAESMRRDSIKQDIERLNTQPSLDQYFWQKIIPETCHYRLSTTEIKWLKQTNRPIMADTCGAWP